MSRARKMKVVAHPDDFKQQKAGDAGFDLRIKEDVTLCPGVPSKPIGTGVKVEIPSNCVGFITIRSSIGLRGIVLSNGIGVIDSGYRGELKIILTNLTKERQTLFAGERVAQLIIVRLQPVTLEFTEQLEGSERGDGGFGSTGRD